MMQPYKNYEGDYSNNVQEFGGLNERLRISENEFSRMENMSLKDSPVLTVRDKRITLDSVMRKYGHQAELVGIGWHGKHITIVEEANTTPGVMAMECKLYINGAEHALSAEYLSLSDSVENKKLPKSIVGMGANVIVMPDKVYFNTENYSEDSNEYYGGGKIENSFEPKQVTVEPCTINGEVYNAKTIGTAAPSSPANGDVWVDTSGKTSAYKVWDASTKQWVGVATTYIKLSCDGIGKGFSKWDCVNIYSEDEDSALRIYKTNGEEITPLSELWNRLWPQLGEFVQITSSGIAKNSIIFESKSSYIIIAGIIDQPFKYTLGVERKMVDSPFYFEHNNRLWGCMYGDNINEIRASKQGDCCNWNSYLGISTDSYAVTVGAPGDFTGGISFGGYPMFFKENCIIKVYGNQPSNYQIITTQCMGVEKGMDKSLVVANGVLFYKSSNCFCAYDGTMPVNISKKLKNVRYKEIQAGATDDRVYFFCTEESGKRYMLVFEIETGIWTKEDSGDLLCFIRDAKGLNFVERTDRSDGSPQWTTYLKSIDGTYDESVITDNEKYPVEENNVRWHFESGDIGLQDMKLKYTKKLVLRADVEAGAKFKVYVSCDNGPFVQRGSSVMSPGLQSVSISLGLERCEKFRYRIEGSGKVAFYSINFEMKEGSEK